MGTGTIMINPQNRNRTTWTTSAYSKSGLFKDIRSLGLKVGDFTSLSVQLPPLLTDVIKCQNSSSEYDFIMIYEHTPKIMVKSLSKALATASVYAGSSVEEILRYYMHLSQSADHPLVLFHDNIPNVLKSLDFIGRLFHLSGGLDNYDDSTSLALKPTILVMLWGSLLMNLSGYVLTSSISENGIEHISRMALSLTFAAIAGLTGYFHSGGRVSGIKSPTSYLRTYFNSQNYIKDTFPSLYYRIPDELKFNTPQSFSAMTSSEKISAGKGMNMAYTFRVGDAFLTSLEGKYTTTDVYMKAIMRKLWPLVSDAEAQKMYKLYTLEQKIYNL